MTIVPANKLIFWTAVTLLPVALAGVIVPADAIVYYLPVLILLLAALADVATSMRRENGFEIDFPPVVRMIENRESAIQFHITGQDPAIRRLRLGLALPEPITADRDRTFDVSGDEPRPAFSWPCTPGRRGAFYISVARLETPSPLGLWSLRRETTVGTTVRVYPDLSPETKHLAWLFSGRQTGVHSLRQIGKGRDFEQLREYQPGDSYEDIHWKATARRGFPVTKTYQIERTQEVYIIIDASRLNGREVRLPSSDDNAVPAPASSPRPPNARTILDHFIAAALISGLAIERQGDLFGLLAFDDRIRGFVKARNGKAHYDSCRDMLYNLYPRRVSPDFNELFTFIGNSLRKRAMLIFLTSLDDPVLTDGFIEHAGLVANRHVIMVNMIRPEGVAPVFSSGPISAPADLYTALSGHLEWENLFQTKNRLKRMGVDFTMVDADRLSLQLTRRYLTVKRSQLL